MQYTIEKILNGETVVDYYQKALKKWHEILSSINPTDSSAIADKSHSNQLWFEHNCGGRWIGQEVMVWSGICQYYSTSEGFGNNFEKAKAMYNGLINSMCSIEIHGHAREVAKLYPELVESE